MARHDVPKQPGVHSTEPTECTSLLGVNERRKGQTGLGSECWHLIRAAAPVSYRFDSGCFFGTSFEHIIRLTTSSSFVRKISGGYLLQNSIQLASITIIGRLVSELNRPIINIRLKEILLKYETEGITRAIGSCVWLYDRHLHRMAPCSGRHHCSR